jgi:multidrug efflux pump subunit AcrA (membrane-fusion protein)
MADEMRVPRSHDEANQVELGREFADANYGEEQRLGNSFADPNALDDARLGKSFEETNSSRRKKKQVVAERKQVNRRPLWIFLLCFAVIFLIVLIVGILPRISRDHEIDKQANAEKNAKPVVDTEVVEATRAQEGLVVPGTTIPLTEAYVYARANGYLKTRLVDIGDRVRKDQLLAVIDAPDLDQQVAQAKEQLRQAQQQLEQQKSQLALATVTVQRYRVLVAKGVFSRQDGDQQEANYASQLANVAAAERNVQAYRANLDRNLALQSYEYVRAPFAGVITQRNVDVGALISAAGATSGMQSAPAPEGQTSTSGGTQQAGQTNTGGSSGNTNQAATAAQSPGQGGPLFGIAQVQRLRILVSVPEGYVTSIHPGGHAQLGFEEYAGKPVIGDVTRTANSVDPNTRTMLTEVQVDNSAGRLVPGMYVVATFPPGPGLDGPLLIDGDAIVIRNDRSVVAVVGGDGRVHFVPVTIGRDFGGAVEVTSGLQAGQTIVTNVTDDVVDGAHVKSHPQKSPVQQPTEAPSQKTPPGGSSMYGDQAITDQNLQGKQAQQNQKSQNKGKSSGEQDKSNGGQSKP